MTGYQTLAETERTAASVLRGLDIDFAAQAAISNLYRAANATRKHFTNTVLKSADLTWTAFVVLWVVWMQEGLETRHVAAEAAISKATLTGVAKTLESRGLIRRFGDVQDRRLVRLSLTSAGTELMVELFPQFNAQEVFVVSGINQPDLTQLTAGLRRIVEHLERDAAEVE